MEFDGTGITLTIGNVTTTVKSFSITLKPGMVIPGAIKFKSACNVLMSGEVTLAVTWEPRSLNEFVALLESHRWLTRGGPLASWYRKRAGFRVADEVEAGRN